MKKVLFINLDAFKQTGGIEKFNRAFMKALQDLNNEKVINYRVYSVYDDKADPAYVDETKHKGFNGKRIYFVIKTLFDANKFDILILGHINLALTGLILKLFKKKLKIILIAHGIEVWDKQPFIKATLIRKADTILAVSNFTKAKILESNQLAPDKIKIFPNTLDPFFKPPDKKEKPKYLLERYGVTEHNKIILTITRINRHEGYKGYDKVLEALTEIIARVPRVKYILCGKHGPIEEVRLKNLVSNLKLNDHFILPGFIKDEELVDHYLLGDVFVLPSKKEGFGIVFIEAAAFGLPVIAGNKDGSVDALQNGELGKLIDPDNQNEIASSIVDLLNKPGSIDINKVEEHFGFNAFKDRLRNLLRDT